MVRFKGAYNIPPKNYSNKYENVQLYLDDHELKEANQYRYLGVIFDKKLTWRPHIEEVGLNPSTHWVYF